MATDDDDDDDDDDEQKNTTKSPRELVESSAVWKTVWKS
jgi:hypothetical protein